MLFKNIFYILLFLYQIKNSVNYELNFLRNLDSELGNAIEFVTPEFAKILKRRFTNVGVSEEIRGEKPSVAAINFTDIFIRDDGNQITLKNFIIQKHPIARMNDIVPNLYEKNLKISADWYNVVLTGSYEMSNSSQLKLLPVKSIGNLNIKIENISTDGLIGFKIFGGALKTTNYDLSFKSENVTIEVEYPDNISNTLTKSIQTKSDIESTIAKYIKRDLYWKLKETLRIRLDHVLQDFTLNEIFEENTEISAKYIAQSDVLDKFLSKIIDQFLKDIKTKIISNGLDKIPAPDFSTSFSHKFGPVTFWGSFDAMNGTIEHLSTLLRKTKFSISSTPENREIRLFGSIGFDELFIHYNFYYAKIWNIGPRGELKASVGENSISLSIIAEIRDWLEFDISVKNLDVRVEILDDVRVKATGMSILLNWLLSYIITWMTGVYKTEIVTMIEKNLKEQLQSFLPKISTQFAKNSF